MLDLKTHVKHYKDRIRFHLLPIPGTAVRRSGVTGPSTGTDGWDSFQIVTAFLVPLKSRNTDHILDPPRGECAEPVLLRRERGGLPPGAPRPEELMVFCRKLSAVVLSHLCPRGRPSDAMSTIGRSTLRIKVVRRRLDLGYFYKTFCYN